MFMLNEVRAQLKKYPNDPACVALVKDLEEYYGYAFDDPEISAKFHKLMDEAQAVHAEKDSRKRQNLLIEFNQRSKAFRTTIKQCSTLTDTLKKDYTDILERTTIRLAELVLGTQIVSLKQ